MKKLTAEKCRERIDQLKRDNSNHYFSLKEGDYLQALEIALPILERQHRQENCQKCGGCGEVDTGYETPRGDSVKVICECQLEKQESEGASNE